MKANAAYFTVKGREVEHRPLSPAAAACWEEICVVAPAFKHVGSIDLKDIGSSFPALDIWFADGLSANVASPADLEELQHALSSRICSAFGPEPDVAAAAEAATPSHLGSVTAAILALQLPISPLYMAQLQGGLPAALEWAASSEVAQRLLDCDGQAARRCRAVTAAALQLLRVSQKAPTAPAEPQTAARLSLDSTLQLGRSLCGGLGAALRKAAQQQTAPKAQPGGSPEPPELVHDLAVALAGVLLMLHHQTSNGVANVQQQLAVLEAAVDIISQFHCQSQVWTWLEPALSKLLTRQLVPNRIPLARLPWLATQQERTVGAVEAALEAASAAAASTVATATSAAAAALAALHDCTFVIVLAMRLLLQFQFVVQSLKEKDNHDYTPAAAEVLYSVHRHRMAATAGALKCLADVLRGPQAGTQMTTGFACVLPAGRGAVRHHTVMLPSIVLPMCSILSCWLTGTNRYVVSFSKFPPGSPEGVAWLGLRTASQSDAVVAAMCSFLALPVHQLTIPADDALPANEDRHVNADMVADISYDMAGPPCSPVRGAIAAMELLIQVLGYTDNAAAAAIFPLENQVAGSKWLPTGRLLMGPARIPALVAVLQFLTALSAAGCMAGRTADAGASDIALATFTCVELWRQTCVLQQAANAEGTGRGSDVGSWLPATLLEAARPLCQAVVWLASEDGDLARSAVADACRLLSVLAQDPGVREQLLDARRDWNWGATCENTMAAASEGQPRPPPWLYDALYQVSDVIIAGCEAAAAPPDAQADTPAGATAQRDKQQRAGGRRHTAAATAAEASVAAATGPSADATRRQQEAAEALHRKQEAEHAAAVDAANRAMAALLQEEEQSAAAAARKSAKKARRRKNAAAAAAAGTAGTAAAAHGGSAAAAAAGDRSTTVQAEAPAVTPCSNGSGYGSGSDTRTARAMQSAIRLAMDAALPVQPPAGGPPLLVGAKETAPSAAAADQLGAEAEAVAASPQQASDAAPEPFSGTDHHSSGKGSTAAAAPPEWAVCLLTKAPMTRPVLAADGHSYEHSAIQARFDAGDFTSPATGELLEHQDLLPNHALRSMIGAVASC